MCRTRGFYVLTNFTNFIYVYIYIYIYIHNKFITHEQVCLMMFMRDTLLTDTSFIIRPD